MFKKKNNSEIDNNLNRLINYYTNLALNIYKWDNLPEGLESRFIEKALFNHGQAFFTEDILYGYMCLPCGNSGNFNIYGEPTDVITYGFNFTKNYPVGEGILIVNNDLKTPTKAHILYYAQRMNEIDKALNQNLRQQKFPYIFVTNKDSQTSMKAMWKKIENGEDALFIDKSLLELDQKGINVVPTLSPFLLDKLHTYKLNLERELLTFLGLNCVAEKTERLIASEANSNDEHILVMEDVGYKNRLLACQAINEKYGLNITVEKTTDKLLYNHLALQSHAESGELSDGLDFEEVNGYE